jgi:hypothetical protein
MVPTALAATETYVKLPSNCPGRQTVIADFPNATIWTPAEIYAKSALWKIRFTACASFADGGLIFRPT